MFDNLILYRKPPTRFLLISTSLHLTLNKAT